jgi:putative transposase
MESLDKIIDESKDVREVKRALSVKMTLMEMPPLQISQMLNVSEPYVRKWRVKYRSGGAQALLLGYQGSESYLTHEQRTASVKWISAHESISVETVRDYIEDNYGVVYQSKQSYYDMMQEAGLSYHKSEKTNPKRDEEQVLARREEIKKKWSNIKKR